MLLFVFDFAFWGLPRLDLHIICKSIYTPFAKHIYTQFAIIFTHQLPIRRPEARRAGRAGRGVAAAVTAL